MSRLELSKSLKFVPANNSDIKVIAADRDSPSIASGALCDKLRYTFKRRKQGHRMAILGKSGQTANPIIANVNHVPYYSIHIH